MASLTLRLVKGSPLTNEEFDDNFSNLNTDVLSRLLASSNLADLTNAGSARTNLGLGDVENKSSATIRGEISSLNVTTALGFTPASKAGDTFTGAVLTSNAGGFTANSAAKLWTDSNRGRLDLYEGAAQTKSLRMMNANGYGIIGMVSAENLELWTNGTARVTINGSTGTSTFAGNAIVNAGADSRVLLQSTGVTEGQFQASATHVRLSSNNSLPLALGTNGVDRVSLASNGQITFDSSTFVGIGGAPTSNARLRVLGTGLSSEVARIEGGTLDAQHIINQSDDPTVNTSRAQLSLRKNNIIGATISIDGASASRGIVYYDAYSATGSHAFYVNSVDRLRINSVGAVSFSSSYGSANQILTSQGSAAVPTWQGLKTVNGNSILGSGNIQIDGGVTSFNTRTGAVTLSSGDVTGALGFTPYDSANPNGYITSSASITGNAATATALQTARSINLVSFNGTADIEIARVRSLDDRTIAPADGTTRYVTSFFTSWGNNNTSPYADALLFRSYTDASGGNDNLLMLRKDALGLRVWQQTYGSATAFSSFKDVAWTDGTNASGTWGISVTGNAATVSSITSGQVTTALGYTPYNSTNPNGYITSSGSISGNAATATNASYAYNYTQGFNSNWNTDFQAAPAGSTILRGDTSSGSSTGGPGGSWWFQQNMRHDNASNFWGVQVAWGWEDNANILRTRNVQNGSYGGWVTYLNSNNYTSYSPSLTGSGASGTWGINVTGSAGSVAWTNVSGRPTAVSSFTNDSAYITTAGARSALSFTAGSGAYNSATGVITIPTNTTHLTNGSGYITSSNYSSYALPLSGGTLTGSLNLNISSGGYGTLNAPSAFASFTLQAASVAFGYLGQGSAIGDGSNSDLAIRSVGIIRFMAGGATTRGSIDASGNFTATGNVTANSDERLKSNWRDLSADFIAKLAALKMGIFDRVDSGETQVGVSAQALQAFLPQAVNADDKGILSVAYGNAALVACVALAREVMALRAELNRK